MIKDLPGTAGSSVVRVTVEGAVGIIAVNSPPVNALGSAVRAGVTQALKDLQAAEAVHAIVLICEGRTFFAGADITEFGKPPVSPTLHQMQDGIEGSAKPVIAAIHGMALGGGLEVALVCHYRIAVPSARLGLPEVHLGLLPGAGGTQRLPRLVGVETALDLIVSGESIGAGKALALGIVDKIAKDGSLYEDAVALAGEIADAGAPLRRIRDRNELVEAARARPEIFSEFSQRRASLMQGFKAPTAIVKAVQAAVDLPFEEGLGREWDLFRELETSMESEAQRHIFFAERECARVPGVDRTTPLRPLSCVGLIGSRDAARTWREALGKAGIPTRSMADWTEAMANGGAALAGCDAVIETAASTAPDPQALASALKASAFIAFAEPAALSIYGESAICLSLCPDGANRIMETVTSDQTDAPTLATALHLARIANRIPIVARATRERPSLRLCAALHRAAGRPGAAPIQTIAAPGEEAASLMDAVAEEGARMVEDGTMLRASDIDVLAVLALDWPAWRGGPMFRAERAARSPSAMAQP